MPSWKDLIKPRDDIISQRFDEAMFTAALDDVILKREKNPIYHEPTAFFDNTHVTRGLRKVITQVFSSLLGKKSGNNVMELRTTFGGGKTHSLIALYHLCQDPSLFNGHPALSEINKEISPRGMQKVRIAALVGSRENVSKRRVVKIDGKDTDINTWCGDIAYQLGGEEGYKIVEANDRDKSAPGKDTLHELFNAIMDPCLILMDEAVTYLVSVAGVDRHLYDETLQFIQQLAEVVSKRDRCAYVFSLPETKIECINKAGEDAQEFMENALINLPTLEKEEAYAAAKKLTHRVKEPIDPVKYIEIFEIIRKRLFKEVDSTHENEIHRLLTSLWDTYKSWGDKLLPDNVFTSTKDEISFREKLGKSYPFHPSLIDVFYKEWGKLSSFQRTRAILRIFAKVINYFWKLDDEIPIIMCGDLPFDKDEDIRNELLEYMGANFESVINSDMKRSKDLELKYGGDYTRWQVCSRLFRSIFLHSLPIGGVSSGALEREILLDVVRPNMTPVLFKDTLRDLNENLFHIFEEGKRYVVKLDTNLNSMIVDRTERIDRREIDNYLLDQMEKLVPKSFPRILWPEDSKDIPKKPTGTTLAGIIYVMCSPDLSTTKISMVDSTSAKLQELVTMHGSTDRVNKNGILFVLMNRGQVDELNKSAGRYLAMLEILEGVESKDASLQQLKNEQLVELIQGIYKYQPDNSLKSKLKAIDKDAKLVKDDKIEISNVLLDAYSHVAHWDGKTFELKELSTSKEKLIERVVDTLDGNLIMKQIDPGYLSRQVTGIVTTESFWNHFFQIPGENLPLNARVVQTSLVKAIKQKKLAYCIYSKGTIDPKVNITDDFPTWLYGKQVEPNSIKISNTAWLLSSDEAEQIISNGEVPPDTPELDDIPELEPYDNQVQIQWSKVENARFYRLFRDDAEITDVKDLSPSYDGPRTSFTDVLEEPRTYYYAVLSGNDYGVSPLSRCKNVEYKTDYPPLASTLSIFSGKNVDSPLIQLKWKASKGAKTYELFTSDKVITSPADGKSVYVGNDTKCEYSLEGYGIFYFTVVAKNEHGMSPISNCEGVAYGKKTPPMAPKLKLQLSGDGKHVELTWSRVNDTSGYRLYRDNHQISIINDKILQLVDGNVHSFADTPTGVDTYYYGVIAYNENGESVLSNIESITMGGEENPVEITLDIDPLHVVDIAEQLEKLMGDYLQIRAEPEIRIVIKAKIPTGITNMAQGMLKNKLENELNQTSGIKTKDIRWDV